MKKSIKLKTKIKKNVSRDLLSKIYYLNSHISKAYIKKDQLIIIFENKISDADYKKIKENIIKLIEKLNLKPQEPKSHILINNIHNKFKNYKDLRKILIEKKEIYEETKGVFVLGNKLTKLTNFLDKKIYSIAKSAKALEYSFPSLMSIDKLNKVNYFDNFPHSCSFSGHLKEDYDIINNFKVGDKSKINKKIDIKTALSPTVCHHLYFFLENSDLKKNMVATAKSNCFRYETKNMNSLERTWNFNMREIIFLGNEKFVTKKLLEIQKKIINFLKSINLSFYVESANDPFFDGNYNDLIAYQNAFKLKYEVRAITPYNNSSIAIGSFNNSQNVFGKKLNIKIKDKFINSACIGFGFERFVYCFVSQYGLNESKWPLIVQKFIK